jgi:hypothetical protein
LDVDSSKENRVLITTDLSTSNLSTGTYDAFIIIKDSVGCEATFRITTDISALGIIVDPSSIFNKILHQDKVFQLSNLTGKKDLFIPYYVIYLVILLVSIFVSWGILVIMDMSLSKIAGTRVIIETKGLWITIITFLVMIASLILI